MKMNDFVKIIPKTEWSERMIKNHGSSGRVGKIGNQNVMIVNNECLDIYHDTFKWGY